MLPGFPIPFPFSAGVLTPEIIASQSFGQSSATNGTRSVSVSYPTGWQEGDLIVALATCAGSQTLNAASFRSIIGPEGWAPVTSNGNARSVQTFGMGIAWQSLMRVAQSGDTSFTFQALNSHRINVSVVVIRGAALPLDAVSHGGVTSGGTLAALTVVADMATLLLMGGFGNASTTDPAVTGPGSTTELLSYTQASGHAGGSRNWMGYEYEADAGSTGTRIWTEDSASNVLAMLSLANGSAGEWKYGKATPATGSWVVPDGVTSINILCVGAGGYGLEGLSGGQGGGGACAYSNDVAVTPGESLTIKVGASLPSGSDSVDNCASYVLRSSTTLVLADYGKPSTPTASPGFNNVGAGGLTTSSTGDTRIAGTSGDKSINNGGQAGTPYGYGGSSTNNQYGIGIGLTGTIMTTTISGYGGGGYQASLGHIAGIQGLVLITWGRNRGFGQSGGRFI